jgi:CheY-like chemotaxis protein
MPKGGRITISTRLVELGAAEAAGNVNRRPGRFVCLAVADTGSGMDAATMNRIFEPFFTTKPVGKGTGLGLATVHGIAAQHKGWVEVDSAQGVGTTFQVYLPAGDRLSLAAKAASHRGPVRRGHETILLVEDEPEVRLVASRSLQALGYRVHEAANGPEAMLIWQAQGAAVDLLFTDMVMPEGMTGLELAGKLQALKPGLKAIISSGYSDEIAVGSQPAARDIVYLPKPYATKALADLLRDCLDAPG